MVTLRNKTNTDAPTNAPRTPLQSTYGYLFKLAHLEVTGRNRYERQNRKSMQGHLYKLALSIIHFLPLTTPQLPASGWHPMR